ncbi:uncharacterized protein [Embiotoca jacksoni]|uniref:uncharacterized protein n=1 Tax=Embiotoca jacksoni TaxID=100190 RepID=UPI003703ACDE
MTSPKFVFYLMCLFLGRMAKKTDPSSLYQESGFISANVGESVTLRCFYQGHVIARIYWYKQILGQKPKLISNFYKYETKVAFQDEFMNNPRFRLDTEIGNNHLIISDLRFSDSATYYCASSISNEFEFAEGITVIAKGSGLNIKALVHQSESIQPGGSVTLNCTVHTGTCDGEHSIYWFKESEESHPGLIYNNGGSNDQCERKPNTQIRTCMYNLPMKSLNPSHAGIYYCAVASCGRILFGRGTKLNSEHEEDSLVLVYILSGALTFTTILTLLTASILYTISKGKNSQRTESLSRVSASSRTNTENCKAEENLHYAALKVKRANRSARPREDTEEKCLYSSIKP